MELLYVDDLVLIAKTEEMLRKWKKRMKTKGLGMNSGKTKVMVC